YQSVYDESLVSEIGGVLLAGAGGRGAAVADQRPAEIVANARLHGLPLRQKSARKTIKHGKVLTDVDIALAIGAGRLRFLGRDHAANRIVGTVGQAAREEHLVAITGVLLQAPQDEAGRAGLERAGEEMAVDRLQPAGHVLRHRALRKIEEDQAFRAAGIVETAALGIRIAPHFRPGEIEVDPVRAARLALLLEADRVG